MLKYRLLTAIILLPILLAFIFLLPTAWFAIFIAIIVSLMMYEWLLLTSVRASWWLFLGSAAVFVISLLSTYLPAIPLLLVCFLLWLWLSYLLINYSKQKKIFSKRLNSNLQIVLGFYLLISYWKAIMVLLQLSPRPWWLLFGILVIWAADVGAYTFGRLYGASAKFLAPAISPKKTWIGLWGGLITGLLIAILFCLMMPMSDFQRIGLIVVSPLVILFSVVGDLFESVMKRKAGVKDSGSLLPGHGGFLDRLDSTMAALPILALILLLLKIS